MVDADTLYIDTVTRLANMSATDIRAEVHQHLSTLAERRAYEVLVDRLSLDELIIVSAHTLVKLQLTSRTEPMLQAPVMDPHDSGTQYSVIRGEVKS